MIHLKEHIHSIERAFTERECQRIIGMGLLESLKPATSGTMWNSDYRSSMIRFIYSADDNYWLFNRFWELLSMENYFCYGAGITTLNFLQFTEYKAEYGGHFSKHTDEGEAEREFYHSTNVRDMIRKITCVLQLSDPHLYDGGDLKLYTDDEKEVMGLRSRGSATIFPSTMMHEVTKVTDGTRYSLVGWFEGPKK